MGMKASISEKPMKEMNIVPEAVIIETTIKAAPTAAIPCFAASASSLFAETCFGTSISSFW